MGKRYLITGGAGFIGTNVAAHYLAHGQSVTIFDNFSRAGSDTNVQWLRTQHGAQLQVVRGDVRDHGGVLPGLVANADVVFHFAAQVAVTVSLTQPRADFETNALGTFNVLEAARAAAAPPIVVYSSTNKVYGGLADVSIREAARRCDYDDGLDGIAETRPLEFRSPHGCSKGAGDQYVLDYARIYGLRTVVFRQSCIYGPHQFGLEDQGWLAWFAIRALRGEPIVLYGDGKQVRDALYVTDLIAAYDAAIEHIATTAGQAYNIGGGPAHTISLLELLALLEQRLDRRIAYTLDVWRPGDQRVFVCDIRKAARDFGWTPRITIAEGVSRMIEWLRPVLGLEGSPRP